MWKQVLQIFVFIISRDKNQDEILSQIEVCIGERIFGT